MERINTADKRFSDGTAAAGYLDGTVVIAKWLNDMQEEVSSVIEATDVTLDGTKQDQLLTAIKMLLKKQALHGQCRLAKSGANVVLLPCNGNSLNIGGVVCKIPAPGVSLPPTGLTPGTEYYVYAYMNAGVMTLEASTTGHSTDADTGVEIKTGDATRTLVGYVRPIAGPAFQDTSKQRLVRTWFNDFGIAGLGSFTANRQTNSTSYVELHSEIRCEFLLWAGEIVIVGGSGISSQSSNGLNSVAVGFDGIANLELGSYSAGYVAAAGGFACPYTINLPKPGLSEGYHFVTLAGKVQTGLGTWSGGTTLPTTPDQCTLTTYIRK